jgi:hypothetical protein
MAVLRSPKPQVGVRFPPPEPFTTASSPAVLQYPGIDSCLGIVPCPWE